MKLWKLTRIDDFDYEEYDSFVVRAKNEERAKEIVLLYHPHEAYGSWTSNDKVKCEEIKKYGKEEIILGSYNAG